MGLVRGADALSEEFINSPTIKQYIDDPKVTIILFENPPYSETTSVEHQKRGLGKQNSSWKNSYIVQEMRKEVSGSVSNDLGNAFIWSAFKYYIRQPADSYIVYSPVKYWKVHHLVNKKFINGFAFNRKHFHTKIDACIMVALWSFTEDIETKEIEIEAYDILDNKLKSDELLPVKKIFNSYSQKYYDKTKYENDTLDGIAVELNGMESSKNGKQVRVKKLKNDNILGYLVANQSGFDNPDLNSGLTIAGIYAGNGFFLRKNNYKEKLPMFSASRYITYNRKWTERTRIMKSADGHEKFNRDSKNGKLEQFFLKNLLFCVLEMKNHCRSFTSPSTNNTYRNELSLDTTNGITLAAQDLTHLHRGEKEQALFSQWDKILQIAKTTQNYNPALTYGVYQIYDELNTSYKDDELNIIVYNYPELNGHIQTLKALLKEYYLSEIVPILFEYEFLK
jgi:hypothetical protein